MSLSLKFLPNTVTEQTPHARTKAGTVGQFTDADYGFSRGDDDHGSRFTAVLPYP